MRQQRVLVLNRAWMAIRFITVQRAIKLLWTTYQDGTPKARVVDRNELDAWGQYTWEDWGKLRPQEDEDGILATDGTHYRLPQIILLTKYDKTCYSQVKFNRKTIYQRDGYSCQYCGEKLRSEDLTLDHVIPRSKGGKTSWENCVVACYECNRQKANRLLENATRIKGKPWRGQSPMRLLKQPLKPKYNLFQGEPPKIIPPIWDAWISELYWTITLENDN